MHVLKVCYLLIKVIKFSLCSIRIIGVGLMTHTNQKKKYTVALVASGHIGLYFLSFTRIFLWNRLIFLPLVS